jgi:hypothetical protein
MSAFIERPIPPLYKYEDLSRGPITYRLLPRHVKSTLEMIHNVRPGQLVFGRDEIKSHIVQENWAISDNVYKT